MAALCGGGGGGERDLCMEEDMEAMEASIEGWKGKGNIGLDAAEVTGLGNPGGNPPVAAAAAARAAKAAGSAGREGLPGESEAPLVPPPLPLLLLLSLGDILPSVPPPSISCLEIVY